MWLGQALAKLGEPKAVLRVRKEDLPLLKEVMEPARDKFKQARPAPARPAPGCPCLLLPRRSRTRRPGWRSAASAGCMVPHHQTRMRAGRRLQICIPAAITVSRASRWIP